MSKALLPYIANSSADVTAQERRCGLNSGARRFESLWMGVLGTRGAEMRCDDRLVAVAQRHADYLDGRVGVELDQNMHVGAGGSTPNQRVRAGGYALLDWHLDGNTVESATRASGDAAYALVLFLHSPPHYTHLMCLGFYVESTVYGIGFRGRDWVVLICPPPE